MLSSNEETPTCALWQHAESFLRQYADESGSTVAPSRLTQVRLQIKEHGYYRHSFDELAYGAKAAWRNSRRCIGKLYWHALCVDDQRNATTTRGVFASIVHHLRYAYNEGHVLPIVTIFSPTRPDGAHIRIWNDLIVQYAGHTNPDGSITGDPGNVKLTNMAYALGWNPQTKSRFDPLPLIIQMPHQHPELFELPNDVIVEVPISHPDYAWFSELGLKWFAFPTLSHLRLEIGGISYPAAPFSGWYVSTEVAARNLADTDRYNMLPAIAQRLKLNTRHDRTLWKDRALLELNVAVLHSFSTVGIRIVDHHTISASFARFVEREAKQGRTVAADWSWIVQPMSPATTAVYKQRYCNAELRPNFFRREPEASR